MKFVVFVLLIFVTVASAYNASKGAAAPAGAKSMPLSDQQISKIAAALDRIVGPQLSRSVINTVTNGGMKVK